MNIPLNIDWQQILLHLMNFVILAGGLYFLLYKPVKAFMDKRAAYYQEQADQAAQTTQAMAERSREKIVRQAGQDVKDLAAEATEKLVLQSGGDAFDQFLDLAEKEAQHEQS